MRDPAKRKAWFKKWKKTPAGKAYMKAWRQTEKGKAVGKRAKKKWLNDRKKNRPEQLMWYAAKARAKKKNVPFALQEKDIFIPTFCPVLGLPLKVGKRNDNNSPSLDRHIPTLGYIPGNVSVISNRANTLKRDASVEELEKVLAYMRRLEDN